VATAMSFVASVTPSQQGPLSPAGSVQFMDNGHAIGSCANQPLGASSTATCTLSYRKLGDHSITASYRGDMSFDGSASAPVAFSLQALGTIDATLQWTFDFTPGYTQVRGLVLNAVPPGASVLLRCQGHGCPFARQVIVASPTRPCGPRGRHRCATHGVIDLTPPLRHKHLSPGARITVEVVKPGWVGKYYMFTVRAGRRPSTRISCTAPGTTSPGAQC
jgi:Bacterial Ig-like domain (group 3)